LPRRPGEPVSEHVALVVNDAFAAGRLFESGATQAELWRIREACVEALREERHEEAEPLTEEFVAVEQAEGEVAGENESGVPEAMPAAADPPPPPGAGPRKPS
jgi:hypothetical protein